MAKGSGYQKKLTFDNLSGCPVGLDFNEHLEHIGYHFRMGALKAMANAEVAYWSITAPAAPWWVHALFIAVVTSEQTLEIFEDPTITVATGTAMTVTSKNRALLRTPLVTGLANPTVTADGTPLTGVRVLSGRNATSERAEGEWILKPGSTYILKATAHAAGYITVGFDWQEHRPETDPSTQPET
jgi:hypothetical protein